MVYTPQARPGKDLTRADLIKTNPTNIHATVFNYRSLPHFLWFMVYTPQARPGKDLTRADLIKIAALPDIDVFWDDLLDPLLVSRTVGSVGHDNVRKHLTDHFEALGWASAVDQFNAITPLGALTFRNLIFTLDPTKPRRFVLAAHYDSKFFESQTFIGASDSAVPCAMIMHLVSILDTALKVAQADELSVRNDTTLEIVFFDGEEAFEKWTATDSIYGARHLAAVWESRNAFACSGTDGAGDAHCDVARYGCVHV
ncbi:hypothetical protein SARC_05773 [Sphaeroforma arctica JP610]|uniref:Peptidase M28 domain-containing protein n=1 Tax=Sphaeroforma arctica JP610 TaxID=667725 RepID=A0A0L0FYJ7_9EUKA|nr:hypothetical protein SARC_05773 [Sphaeroforma arctica JP610]KNC81922.1 hypothetical protein SARC_05773 [Sphaeroforma arctica JP610]|eukprot:XP_014155824.1 hypothetical protein SARC_05773 [Sphaeroforma arctica JP610]